MANNGDGDDYNKVSRQMRDIRVGLDATEAWSEVAARIADALEHQVIGQMMMQLVSLGGKPEMRSVQHRVDCPGCALGRQIVNQVQRASLIQAPPMSR